MDREIARSSGNRHNTLDADAVNRLAAEFAAVRAEVVALVAEREQALLKREHVAAALLFGRDVPPDDVWWRWASVVEHAKLGHCGDCTKQAFTCDVCSMERALEEADAVIATLRALAASPQPERTP